MMPNKPQSYKASQSQKSQVPPKKVYSREFKLETLRPLKSSGKTKADLERELGLYPGQIHLWERAFNREGGNVEQAFPGTGHQSDAEAELSQLRRENEILRQLEKGGSTWRRCWTSTLARWLVGQWTNTWMRDWWLQHCRWQPPTASQERERFTTPKGSQYAAHNYQRLLSAHHLVGSMSRKGDCYDTP